MGRFQEGTEKEEKINFSITQTPKAEDDILNALKWYAVQRPGLDNEFLLSLEAELNIIQRNPFIYAVLYKQIRRALISRFPYAIFFLIERNEILILAAVHQRRNPSVWKKRKRKY